MNDLLDKPNGSGVTGVINVKISHFQWFSDMLKFDVLKKGLGVVSPPHVVYDFSRKMFPMLYSINWPKVIVWLLLIREISGNMCTEIVYFQVVRS